MPYSRAVPSTDSEYSIDLSDVSKESSSFPGITYDSDDGNFLKTKLFKWPIVIVAGQLSLFFIAWGFYAAVSSRGQLPLGTGVAIFLQDNPQSKTYVLTLLSTGLSMLSSYLFTQAVRHAIVVSLTLPTPVSSLGFGIMIARRSYIPWDRREVKWFLVGGTFFFGTLAQTAGWSSLFTPTLITIETPLVGTEIDFTTNAFNKAWEDLNLNDTLSYGFTLPGVVSSLEASGASVAENFLNFPTSLNFIDFVFDVSTGGILPSSPSEINGIYAGSTITPHSNVGDIPPYGLSQNYAMIQQGLTATVSCVPRNDLSSTSNPPLVSTAFPEQSRVNGELFYEWSWATSCSGNPRDLDTSSSVLYSFANNTVVALGCLQDFESISSGSNNYTLIVQGQNVYEPMGTMVCSITPKIGTYRVDYGYRGAVSAELITSIPTVDAGFIGYTAVQALLGTFGYSQGYTSNSIGNEIIAVYDSITNREGKSQSDAFAEIMEAYLIGIIAFSGTATRILLSESDSPISNGTIPPDMTRQIEGIHRTQTLGWDYNARKATGIAVLLPITFIALASIAIVAVAQYHNHGIPASHANFDPNNPFLLMAAASAGGMHNTFHTVDKVEDLATLKQKKVKFGRIGNRDCLVETSTV